MSRRDYSVIRARAGGACEYCLLPDAYSVFRYVGDHIVARQHGGADDADNLAYCCPFCNANKGPNVSGIDPVGGEVTRLYHPRRDQWSDHFLLEGAWIEPLGAIGRVTVIVLKINHPNQLSLRQAVIRIGEELVVPR